jgi:hypothetical protein
MSNEKDEVVVTKVKLIFDESTGGHMELSDYIPREIASDLAKQLMDWRDNWMASFSEVKKVEEKINEFSVRWKDQQVNPQP